MVNSIYEKEQLKRLKENNLVIETFYSRNKADYIREDDTVYIRSSDGMIKENITNKPIKEKRYFLNNECIYRETNFNDDIVYNIKNVEIENRIITCPNCGNSGKLEEFNNGCPFCKTNFNIGINRRNKGANTGDIDLKESKEFYKDTVFALLTVFAAVMFPIALLMIFMPGNEKIAGVVIIIIITLFMLYLYKFKAVFKKKIKDKNGNYNEVLQKRYDLEMQGYVLKTLPWTIQKDEEEFYNALNNNLCSLMYENNKEIIDFDLMKYTQLDFISENEAKIICEIREVYFNKEITSIIKKYEITMKYNEDYIHFNETYKTVKCKGCGASIDVTQKYCKSCGKKVETEIPWSITNMKNIDS